MKRIAIVTDSTSDIPQEIADSLGITIIPLMVNFGMKQYRDGIDIKSDQFYQMLAQAEPLPTTSQPSPAEFQQLYEALLQEHESVISIHLSAGLSGTLNSAIAAKEVVKGNIHLIDSRSISLGIGALVLEAVELVQSGLQAAEVVERLLEKRNQLEVLFTLDTLEYLRKGGRIGRVQATMGSLLNIKPIVRVVEGVYVTAGKARRQEQALMAMANLFTSLADGRKVKRIAVAHGAAPEAARRLTKLLEQAFETKVGLFTQVGPVIGVHTGPGTVGACLTFA
ncbi:MAG: DegV family protein [Bacillota bacterium]|jgi:DegV family protein with EDD domain